MMPVLFLICTLAFASAAPDAGVDVEALATRVRSSDAFKKKVATVCSNAGAQMDVCENRAADGLFCELLRRSSSGSEVAATLQQCGQQVAKPREGAALAQISSHRRKGLRVAVQANAGVSAPEDELAQEMTHDLEMNFNKIAPFGKEDTAKELQDHAAKTQDTLVDAVENAEVA